MRMSFDPMKFVGLLLVFALILKPLTVFAQNELRLGLINYVRPAPKEPLVQVTIEKLRQNFPDYEIRVERLYPTELKNRIKEGTIDIFLGSSGFYREMISYGARDLAVVASTKYPDPNKSEGTAIIVRNSDVRYQALKDLQGTRVATLSADAFYGYQVPMAEFVKRGFDPNNFFSKIIHVDNKGYADKVLQMLANNHVDTVFLKTCHLEKYIAEHPEMLNVFRVLEEKHDGPCKCSTPLYPTWVLATTAMTDPSISREITAVLLSIPKVNDDYYWSIPTNYSSVDELQKVLKTGAYSYLNEWTVSRIVKEYWPWIAMVFILVTSIIAHSLRAGFLVRKTRAELQEILNREKKLQLEASAATKEVENLQKRGLFNQLSMMLAHEMRQPLGTISLFVDGLSAKFENQVQNKEQFDFLIDKIKDQIHRANGIVEKARSYRKSLKHEEKEIDLAVIVERAIEIIEVSFSHKIKISKSLSSGIVYGDSLELELLAVNIIKNATESVADLPLPEVFVGLAERGKYLEFRVSDNGTTTDIEHLKRLIDQGKSTKVDGLGLGLKIVEKIVKHHGGEMEFSINSSGHGVCVRVLLPKGASDAS